MKYERDLGRAGPRGNKGCDTSGLNVGNPVHRRPAPLLAPSRDGSSRGSQLYPDDPEGLFSGTSARRGARSGVGHTKGWTRPRAEEGLFTKFVGLKFVVRQEGGRGIDFKGILISKF